MAKTPDMSLSQGKAFGRHHATHAKDKDRISRRLAGHFLMNGDFWPQKELNV